MINQAETTAAPKLVKVRSYKGEATYTFGDYRIYTERKSSGTYPQKRRNWTDVCIAHNVIKGTDRGFCSVKSAVEAINKGKVKLLGGL
jgi:hypothetical protein